MGKHALALYAPAPNDQEKTKALQERAQAGVPIRGEELEKLRKDRRQV